MEPDRALEGASERAFRPAPATLREGHGPIPRPLRVATADAPPPHGAGVPGHPARALGETGSGVGGGRRGGARTHLLVALTLALLTLLAFWVAGDRLLPTAVLLPVIGALAIVQIALQGLFYMHLRWDRRLFGLVFAAAALLGAFIAWAAWYLLASHLGRT